MRFDITSGKVGQGNLISISLLFQHQNPFLIKRAATEVPTPEIQAELKRHVHPVVFAGPGRLAPAQIMDRVFGSADEIFDLFQTGLTRINPFRGDPRLEPKPDQTEQDRLKKRLILII